MSTNHPAITDQQLSPPISEFTEIIERRDRAVQKASEGLRLLQEAADTAPGHILGVFTKLTFFGDIHKSNIERVEKKINAATWERLLERSGLSVVMNAEELAKTRQEIRDNAPTPDHETVISTFIDLFTRRHDTFRKGMADLFRNLCRHYKTNGVFAIGKKVILDNALSASGWEIFSHAPDQVNDLNRIMTLLDGQDPVLIPRDLQLDRLISQSRRNNIDQIETPFFDIRLFKNGNIHIMFTRPDLIDAANRLIADHYGSTLPQDK